MLLCMNAADLSEPTGPTRRTVLAATGAIGVTAALAACSSSDSGSSSGTGSGSESLTTADVPVGGGAVLKSQQVVVTQPSSGQYKAFSAVCTHQGCIVAKVESGSIVCTCHNSMFSITDGSVQSGPATSALAARTVTVNGTSLTVS
jgi:nitrite reductase/ring-hydroxylating ferredoxin subunit